MRSVEEQKEVRVRFLGDKTDHKSTSKVYESVTFVVAVNDRRVLDNTFLVSPIFNNCNMLEIIIKEGYSSASTAYNEGLDEATSDLIVFAHQDIFFPEKWLDELFHALFKIEVSSRRWGVVGCFGVTSENNRYGHLFSTGLDKVLGGTIAQPMPVQTLDEIVLVMRKSAGLRFDEDLPHFHFYGADICMLAKRAGMVNYAIDAFCIHNSNQVRRFPKEFYQCYHYVKNKYKPFLPIQTSCIRITRHNGQCYLYKILQSIACIRNTKRNVRTDNPAALWEQMRSNIKYSI